MVVTPDGRRAVSSYQDNTLKVWDLKSGEPNATYSFRVPVHCCAVVNDRTIVVGDDVGRVYCIALETA